MLGGDEIIRVEKHKIEQFVALGLGHYDAVTAVVAERGCPAAAALEIAR
jgi:hypothetical protein